MLAVFGVLVDVFILLGALLLARFVRLARPYRPESVTLTPGELIYDPGHFDFGDCVSAGTGCTVGRSQLTDIRLDRVGARRRLTADRGMERIEVGACRGEREREWLADVLRAWANPEQARACAAGNSSGTLTAVR